MKFQVDVSWTVAGGQIIEADTEAEARKIANGMRLDIFNGDYIEDSFSIDTVEETTEG